MGGHGDPCGQPYRRRDLEIYLDRSSCFDDLRIRIGGLKLAQEKSSEVAAAAIAGAERRHSAALVECADPCKPAPEDLEHPAESICQCRNERRLHQRRELIDGSDRVRLIGNDVRMDGSEQRTVEGRIGRDHLAIPNIELWTERKIDEVAGTLQCLQGSVYRRIGEGTVGKDVGRAAAGAKSSLVRRERLLQADRILRWKADDESGVGCDACAAAQLERFERFRERDILADVAEDSLRTALQAEVDRGTARRGHLR